MNLIGILLQAMTVLVPHPKSPSRRSTSSKSRMVDALTVAAVATVTAAVTGTGSMPGMQVQRRMVTAGGSEDAAGAGVSALLAPLPARLPSQPVLPRLSRHRWPVQMRVHLTLLVVSRGAASAEKMLAGVVVGVTLRSLAAAAAAVAGSVAVEWSLQLWPLLLLLLLYPIHPLRQHRASQLKAPLLTWRCLLWLSTSKSLFLSQSLHQWSPACHLVLAGKQLPSHQA